MATKKDARDGNVTFVPIRFKDDVERPDDGEDIYRREGAIIIEEPEILGERPLYEDSGVTEVAVKPSDVQHAPYEIENPPSPYYDDEDIFGEPAEEEPLQDDIPPNKRQKPEGEKNTFGGFIKKNRLAVIIIAVAVLLVAGYITSSVFYNSAAREVKATVKALSRSIEVGSGNPESSLADEVAFYSGVFKQADDANAALSKLNKNYFFIIFKQSREDVGLISLESEITNIEPYLKRIDPIMNQVETIALRVLGTSAEPGHLLSYLDPKNADDILKSDIQLIDNLSKDLENLTDLPASFTDGIENQKARMTEMREETALLREYLAACAPAIEKISEFSSAAETYYASSATSATLGTELYRESTIISMIDPINTMLDDVNSARKYNALRMKYGITNLGLGEAGKKMIDESGVIVTAYDIVSNIYDEEAGTLASARNNGTEKDVYAQAIQNNAEKRASLDALTLPDRYSELKKSYISALDIRASYLAKYSEAVAFRLDAAAKASEASKIQKEREELYASIWTSHPNQNEIRQILADCEEMDGQAKELLAASDAAKASMTTALGDAAKLYDQYISAIQIVKN